ncbi:MAG: DUF433 domain-containing protein [Phycisphaeraceae bacterium]|nr:DUF433 domain-containing protein [Phycisphaeraceae bacterium]
MEAVRADPEIMHGTPCFAGTRVPATILFDYLRAGSTVAEFLEQYPTVSREQVDSVLATAERQFEIPRRAAG